MSTLAKAVEIAARAHVSQKDKRTGEPYVLHPLRLMTRVDGEHAKMAAVLHDVVEDTPVTLDDLRREGFPEPVLQAVAALTRRDDETYAQFIVRCRNDPVALRVKLADLEDNANLPRALLRADRVEKDLNRLTRYHLSYRYLINELPEPLYLQWMAKFDAVAK